MLEVRTLQCNPIQENCFLLSDASGDAVVVDCGAYYDAERQAVVDYLRKQQLTLRHVLCTHAHFDHIFGLDLLYSEFGLLPRLHPADNFIYHDMESQTRQMLGTPYARPMPPLGQPLADGEEVAFGSHQLRVLHTPGHTPGSVVFYEEREKMLFAGDTLFRFSVGRTDLTGGSWPQLMQSLHNVVALLPEDVAVFPGHGPTTTIGDELRHNPYLRH